ncbi:ABC transporter permease [Cellulomonas cellasea]|uniref:ABC transporter permease n=2 Tax=Cellulomonas cellasea TaxID=43670 RepID=A0A0A0B287_9CELL|nr:ABC transporter permease [Cellulomonas cellasea]KGM00910.1 ABC transporter permease [Cellulomonas cellasea DSM 20118]GEA87209.1 ABC transporter permease [Cellulomonas cellasea]
MKDRRPSRLLTRDVLRLGVAGLRSRPARAVLSALGIAIGIGAMVAVVGISTSSEARFAQQLATLGTNLLTITPGQTLAGRDAVLPPETVPQVRRLPGVLDASSVARLDDLTVYRSEHVDPRNTNGISVLAADQALLDVTGGQLAAGRWHGPATDAFPTVVLGHDAARRLGVTRVGSQVVLAGQPFTVVGVLAPVALAPELDPSALVSEHVATERFGYSGSPSTVFERSTDESVADVRALLPATVSPAAPEEVTVSRPSDALAARYAADSTFSGLLLGLGSVALLVGGVGVANTMIVSVLERRREIGLRRALGATRAHVRAQFLAEAVLLTLVGGVGGALLGLGVTVVFTLAHGWVLALPPSVLGAAVAATVLVGAGAGLYPAVRAARIPPTAALSS